MKIRLLLLITLCAATALQADETWGQWAQRGFFAAVKKFGHSSIFSKVSSPFIEKHKTAILVSGGSVSILAGLAGAVWYNKYRQDQEFSVRYEEVIANNKINTGMLDFFAKKDDLAREIDRLDSFLYHYDSEFASLQSKINTAVIMVEARESIREHLIQMRLSNIQRAKMAIAAIENEISSLVKNPTSKRNKKFLIAHLESNITTDADGINLLRERYRPLQFAQGALADLIDEMTCLKTEKEHTPNKLEQKLKELRSLEKAQRVLGISDNPYLCPRPALLSIKKGTTF